MRAIHSANSSPGAQGSLLRISSGSAQSTELMMNGPTAIKKNELKLPLYAVPSASADCFSISEIGSRASLRQRVVHSGHWALGRRRNLARKQMIVECTRSSKD